MRRKSACPRKISPELRELDQALNFLPTIEVRHPNAMHPGNEWMLWNSGRAISWESASAKLGEIIEAHRPPQSVLEQLATLARIPTDVRSDFRDRLDAAVLVAWYPHSECELPEFAVIADDFAKVEELSRDLHDALQLLRGTTKALFDAFCGRGYPGYALREQERALDALLDFGADLRMAAGRQKRSRGGQLAALRKDHAELQVRKVAQAEMFVRLAYGAVIGVGGRLTVNKNDISEGSLWKFLQIFEPFLPGRSGTANEERKFLAWLTPKILYRIRAEVDREYPRRA